MLGLSLLAACSSSKDEPAPTKTQASGLVIASAAPQAEARKVEVSNDLMDFDYSYPAQAAAIPALKAMLDSDLAELAGQDPAGHARRAQGSAKEGGREPRTYSHSTAWKVVTEIPGWLSLSADRYEFTGGAHGNPYFDTLLWDKARQCARRDPLRCSRPKRRCSAAIQPAVCDQIDKQREEKREEPVVRGDDDFFSAMHRPGGIDGDPSARRTSSISTASACWSGPYPAGPYAGRRVTRRPCR